MTPKEILEKQEFLLGSKHGNYEGLIVCPRCNGWGCEDTPGHIEEVLPCKKCHGERVVKRRVMVVVEDKPIGGGE